METELEKTLNRICTELSELQAQQNIARGLTNLKPDEVHWKERSKFVAIDVGTSGAWLVEKATGEIFNIKAYGVPDQNKKRKSDIGNIYSVEPARMFSLRWNYLR